MIQTGNNLSLQTLGPYELHKVIGRGGMGTVYQAVDTRSGDIVAVKALAPVYSFDEHFRKRFESEIDTLTKLDHPNIVRILSFGQEDGNLFFAMELVEGSSLFQKQKTNHKFIWQEVLSVGRDVASGLRHAHDRGIIHRDMKPGNLLLNPKGLVKITDFGIAKTFGGSQLTGDGNIVGTMDFMAPEQTLGKPATARSDLYGLGIVMYTLFSGKPPYAGMSVEQTIERLTKHQVPRIETVIDDIPEPIADLIHQLIEKDPEKRIPTALALLNRIDTVTQELKSYAEAKTSIVSESNSDELEIFSRVVREPQAAKPGDDKTRMSKPASSPEKTRLSKKREPSKKGRGRALDTVATASRDDDLGSVSRQPDYFSPVTDQVRKNRTEDDDYPENSGRIWPVAVLFFAVLGLLSFGLYYTLLRKIPADTLLTEIDEEKHHLYRVRDEMKNFIRWYPDHERSEQIENWLAISEAQTHVKTLQLKSRTRLNDVELKFLDIANESEKDGERGLIALNDFVTLHDIPDLNERESRCIRSAKAYINKIELDAANFHAKQVEAVQRALDRADEVADSDRQKAIAILNSVINVHSDYEGISDLLDKARSMISELEEKQ